MVSVIMSFSGIHIKLSLFQNIMVSVIMAFNDIKNEIKLVLKYNGQCIICIQWYNKLK